MLNRLVLICFFNSLFLVVSCIGDPVYESPGSSADEKENSGENIYNENNEEEKQGEETPDTETGYYETDAEYEGSQDEEMPTDIDFTVPENDETQDEEQETVQEPHEYPDIQGVWELKSATIEEVFSDCGSLIKNGVSSKPFRKIIKKDTETVRMDQCSGDDWSCEEVLYEIGVFNYENDTVYGLAEVKEKLGTFTVETEIDPNEIVFTSESKATVYNKI
ncbi:MAG: hypothetical protein R6W70_07635, partial [bacterium]